MSVYLFSIATHLTTLDSGDFSLDKKYIKYSKNLIWTQGSEAQSKQAETLEVKKRRAKTCDKPVFDTKWIWGMCLLSRFSSISLALRETAATTSQSRESIVQQHRIEEEMRS